MKFYTMLSSIFRRTMGPSMHTAVNRQRPRLLLIDDSSFEQSLLMDMLGRKKFTFSAARNGAQGYEMALWKIPNLILLDVRMPDMDGLAVCRLLKANEATRDIPVIFLSGACDAKDRTAGLTVGAVDYVSKPFSPEELLARIDIHLMLAARQPRPGCASTPPARFPAACHTGHEDVTVTAAKRYILEYLAEPPPLQEIARRVGSYREKLSPLFREQTGMTMCEFIRRSRIEWACELLQNTAMGIQDIAMAIGYNSGGNFATAFREIIGVTPKRYRRAQLPLLEHDTH